MSEINQEAMGITMAAATLAAPLIANAIKGCRSHQESAAVMEPIFKMALDLAMQGYLDTCTDLDALDADLRSE